MIPKIWNYSGWINDPSKTDFLKLFSDIGETVISQTEAQQNGINSICYFCENLTFAVSVFTEDGSAFINAYSTDDSKIYDLLSIMTDYFDLLINDADNSIYPARLTPLLQDNETEESGRESHTKTH